MKDFESQVARAGMRLRNRENGSLIVKPNPHRPHRLSWGWIATPASAVIGIFIGVEIGRMSGTPMTVTAQVWDTVVERRVVYDTVPVVQQEKSSVPQRSDRKKPLVPPASVRPEELDIVDGGRVSSSNMLGKCILDDGVDYSLLCEVMW